MPAGSSRARGNPPVLVRHRLSLKRPAGVAPYQPYAGPTEDTVLDCVDDVYHNWIGIQGGGEDLRYERSIAIAKRHDALLALVRSGTYSCPKLAAALAVSLPTVSRDIVFLRRQGYGIESVRRRAGWAYELTDTPDSQPRFLREP